MLCSSSPSPFQLRVLEYNNLSTTPPRPGGGAAAVDDIAHADPSVSASPSPAASSTACASSSPFVSGSERDSAIHLFLKSHIYLNQRQGDRKTQEDTMFFWDSHNYQVQVMAQMDGHGEGNGFLASNTVGYVINDFFNKYESVCASWTEDEWVRQLTQLFQLAHDTFRVQLYQSDSKNYYIDEHGVVRWKLNNVCIKGGTTCTLMVNIKRPNGSSRIYCAQVGDSECIVIPVSKPKNIIVMTVDHSPSSFSEWERVQKDPKFQHKMIAVYSVGNRFCDCSSPQIFNLQGNLNQIPEDVDTKNYRLEKASYVVNPESVPDRCSFAMTRAIGDFAAQQLGVTSSPVITCLDIPPGEECLVQVFTDGVGDGIRNMVEFASCSVQSYLSHQRRFRVFAQQYVNKTFETCSVGFDVRDDASIALMAVKGQPVISQTPGPERFKQLKLFLCDKLSDEGTCLLLLGSKLGPEQLQKVIMDMTRIREDIQALQRDMSTLRSFAIKVDRDLLEQENIDLKLFENQFKQLTSNIDRMNFENIEITPGHLPQSATIRLRYLVNAYLLLDHLGNLIREDHPNELELFDRVVALVNRGHHLCEQMDRLVASSKASHVPDESLKS